MCILAGMLSFKMVENYEKLFLIYLGNSTQPHQLSSNYRLGMIPIYHNIYHNEFQHRLRKREIKSGLEDYESLQNKLCMAS